MARKLLRVEAGGWARQQGNSSLDSLAAPCPDVSFYHPTGGKPGGDLILMDTAAPMGPSWFSQGIFNIFPQKLHRIAWQNDFQQFLKGRQRENCYRGAINVKELCTKPYKGTKRALKFVLSVTRGHKCFRTFYEILQGFRNVFFSFYKAFKRARKTLELCTNRYKGPETPWNFIRNNTRGQKWPQSVGWGPKQPLNFRRSFKIGQRGFELCTMLYKRPETLSRFVKSVKKRQKHSQSVTSGHRRFWTFCEARSAIVLRAKRYKGPETHFNFV